MPVILQDGSSSYVYGLGLISSTDAGGSQTYYHTDGLGSTRALTDGTGSTVATYEYDAFGAIRNQTGTAANAFKYTGEQHDSGTDMYYLRARHYDPEVGRFISRDPFPGFDGSPQTQNPYAYVSNDPINATDPSGECLVDTAADVGFIGYDLFRLAKDNVFGKEDNLGENMLALGADGVGLFIPCATGGGLAVRAGIRIVGHGDNTLDAARAIGRYGDVGGHHIHAKAAFRGDPNYHDNNGLSISQEYMSSRGWDHGAMSAYQHRAFRELASSGGPNTIYEHNRIAVNALKAGGVPEGEARHLVALSLQTLRSDNVRTPTRIPWTR